MNQRVAISKLKTLALTLQSELAGYPSRRRLVSAGLTMGGGVSIGKHTYIDRSYAWAISIGSDTTISWGVTIIAHDAALQGFSGYTSVAPIAIGSRVYVGARAVILPGTVIGDDAVIGAGSVVRGKIDSGVIYAGSPARPVANPDESAARLLARGWPRLELPRAQMGAGDIVRARELLAEAGGLLIR